MISNQPASKPIEEFSPQIEEILQFGVCTIDSKTSKQTWSSGLYSVLGLEPFSVEPETEFFLKHINVVDLPVVLKTTEESKRSQKPYKIEFLITDANGIQKKLKAENFFNYDENNVLAEQKIVIKNITENYLYNQQLELKINHLNKSNNNLKEFVHVASHDLQEPLRKIAVFTEKLSSEFGSSLEGGAEMFISKISNSVKNMQLLLEDLLRFSTLAASEIEFKKVSVNEIIKSVLSDLEIKIERSNCSLNCSDIPLIDGYPSQIRQLFSNLISNSIKFKKEGTAPAIKIHCEEARPKDYPQLPILLYKHYIKITFSDNGIGFDQAHSEKIFQVFQRLHSKAEYPGSGIGLSICKKIMENHHGYIFAEGSPGTGATFTLLFPKTQH
jgi:light-regulated signal transduction histidine kinase (bacteriophytochrome)